MKTKKGHTWYRRDLHLYNDEFLIEIINDLVDELEEISKSR